MPEAEGREQSWPVSLRLSSRYSPAEWRSDEAPRTQRHFAHLHSLRDRIGSRLPAGSRRPPSPLRRRDRSQARTSFRTAQEGREVCRKKPHKFGLRLRYDLMVGIRRFATRSEAERAEAVVAKVLENRGHRVFWG